MENTPLRAHCTHTVSTPQLVSAPQLVSTVLLNGVDVATVLDLDIHPILGGSQNNTGSVAFGGPQGYTSMYRNLEITNLSGESLYRNDFLLASRDRTLADFAVGTNALSCTIPRNKDMSKCMLNNR